MKPLRDIFHMPLVHGRFEIDLMKAIFKLNLVIGGRVSLVIFPLDECPWTFLVISC